MNDIPWDKLGIPDAMRASLDPKAPRPLRMGAAKGALPATPEAQLGMLYVLACDEDEQIRETALATLKDLPNPQNAITQRTHPKILELLATLRADHELDRQIMLVRNTNDRTACLVAGRADASLAEQIAENHDRLLITPDVILALHQNPQCPEPPLERAISFLRMQKMLPELPASRPKKGEKPAPAPEPAKPVVDIEAEIMAALEGRASPMLEERQKIELFDLDKLGGGGGLAGFSFDFKNDDDFGLDMLEDRDDHSDDERLSIEKRIAGMTIGKKIKLAFLGNKTVRGILIRDRSKQVAVAVVKGGRCSDAEVLSYAGNRNLPDDVLREIAMNKEWMRKYPLKVALAANPKCPASVAVGLVTQLQAKDLAALARNKNVSSVVFQMAGRLMREKKKD
ncbi:MAG: hypothetical protein ACOZNI_02945 [Myxococcota bacterium]